MTHFDSDDIADPMQRIGYCADALTALTEQINIITFARRAAMLEARADGYTLDDIAERAKISQPRVVQIIHAEPR